MTFRYERLLERQKDLEHKSNRVISEDVKNVQKILKALRRQREETDIIRQHNNNNNNVNSLHKTSEEKEQPNNNVIDIDAGEENAGVACYYKIKAADWYASLLIYNSY